jgi:hypothetical protein
MTAARNLTPSDEAHWTGPARIWAHVQQFPPRKERSSWWLALAGVLLVALAIGAMR